MPRTWFHITWNTYGTWLPGDPRGFRSHNHRIHSSGTYKSPPPPGEHHLLHQRAKRELKREPIRLNAEQQRIALDAVLAKAMDERSLRQIQASIASKKLKISEDEARELARRALQFKAERGRLPDIQSPDAWEKRMAEGVAAFARYRAQAKQGAAKAAAVGTTEPGAADHG
jgi:hypothetical protein